MFTFLAVQTNKNERFGLSVCVGGVLDKRVGTGGLGRGL